MTNINQTIKNSEFQPKDAQTLFLGSFKKFQFFINDFVKNMVPSLTRKYRTGPCELCGKEKATDSAHIHGRERHILIKEAFNGAVLSQKGPFYIIDLDKFKKLIQTEHKNLNNFHFLCKKCHRLYDAKNSNISEADFKKHLLTKTTLITQKNCSTSKTIKPTVATNFANYLNTKKLNKKTIAAYTIHMPNFIKGHFFVDLFKFDEAKTISTLLDIFLEDQFFVIADQKGHRIYTAGIKKYIEYLNTLADKKS